MFTTGDTGGALNPQKCYVHSSLSKKGAEDVEKKNLSEKSKTSHQKMNW